MPVQPTAAVKTSVSVQSPVSIHNNSNQITSTCITYTGSLDVGDAILNTRLNRNGLQSTCGFLKAFPGTFSPGPFYYDIYNYTNTTGATQCLTVTCNTGGIGNVFPVVYLGSFNPANVATNYLADGGVSTGQPPALVTFSFNLASGATSVLVLNETIASEVCPSYTASISTAPATFNVTSSGICIGGTGVLVGLDGSEAGINYQLKLNGINIGATVAGSGSAITFGNQTASGNYTVVALGCGGISTAMSGSATLSNCVGIGKLNPDYNLDVIGPIRSSGDILVRNDKGLIRSVDGTQQKKLTTAVFVNSTIAPGASINIPFTFSESFSSAPDVYIGNVTGGLGGFAEVIMSVANVTTTGGSLFVNNPRGGSYAPNFTVKVIAIGPQ